MRPSLVEGRTRVQGSLFDGPITGREKETAQEETRAALLCHERYGASFCHRSSEAVPVLRDPGLEVGPSWEGGGNLARCETIVRPQVHGAP